MTTELEIKDEKWEESEWISRERRKKFDFDRRLGSERMKEKHAKEQSDGVLENFGIYKPF